MTRAELLALAAASPTCDVPTAGRAFGLGSNGSYEAVHRGEFPVRVLRIGRRMRVPTADLLIALGVNGEAAAPPAAPATTNDPHAPKREESCP